MNSGDFFLIMIGLGLGHILYLLFSKHFVILTKRKAKLLGSATVSNNLAEMNRFAIDNNFEDFSYYISKGWDGKGSCKVHITCAYKGVKLKDVVTLQQMKDLVRLKDELDIKDIKN